MASLYSLTFLSLFASTLFLVYTVFARFKNAFKAERKQVSAQ